MKKLIQKQPKLVSETSLLMDIRRLIETSRQGVAVTVNVALSILYWNVGKRINDTILGNVRAEYGKRIIATLAQQLMAEYGKGWGEDQLRLCMRYADVFPTSEIPDTLCRELSWSHIRMVLPIQDLLKRDFYIEMCKIEHWGVRTLRERIDSMLYERTAISRKPEKTIKRDLALLKNEGKMTPDLAFRDPYFLDFLGLKDTFAEKDLEGAILSELQRFIIEFGTDFAFLARQKRITIDNDDYYIDLLFYHRRLRRLIAIDLKLGEFKPEHKAQMEVYLRWLEKNERRTGEKKPLGIILCAGKKQKLIELLELDKLGIHIAEYLTELPPRDLLEQKLNHAVKSAKLRLEGDRENR